MTEALLSLFAFLVAVGTLVVVHEFGHFWVARRLGVKVLRFSIGFGRALWGKRIGRDQTELVIAALPLGGYVKMLDEREGEVAPEERHREFNGQGLAVRSAIVAAGPVFNLLFAVVAYWLMFVIGVTGMKPRVGAVEPDSSAARAGFAAGQEIIAVESRPTPTWEAVVNALLPELVDGKALSLTVREAGGGERRLTLDLAVIALDDLAKGDLLRRLGLHPYRIELPAVIGEVLPGGAAERGGVRAGDRVVTADGRPITSWEEWVDYVRTRPGQRIRAEVERGEERLYLDLTPDRVEEGGKTLGRIGVGMQSLKGVHEELVGVERYTPMAAVGQALRKTVEVSLISLKVFGKMLTGGASVQNLSGPISIAQFAGRSAEMGLTAFLYFLGIVSVSLAILNLLPIPMLDGGHLMYYLIELVRRRPVSLATQQIGQQIGIAILVGLMGLALYNDITRFLR